MVGHRLERVLVHGRRVERHCCGLCRWDFVERRFAVTRASAVRKLGRRHWWRQSGFFDIETEVAAGAPRQVHING